MAKHCASKAEIMEGVSNSDSELAKPASKNKELSKRSLRPNAKRFRTSDDEESQGFASFKDEIKEIVSSINTRLEKLENKLQDVNRKSDSIQTTSKDIEKSLEHVSGQVEEVQAKIEGMERERKVLSSQIHLLEHKLENQERQLKKTSIEIRNVPSKTGEKKSELFEMINNLNTSLDLEGTREPYQVRDVYRYLNRANAKVSTIVVELSSTLEKEKFLRSVKNYAKKRSDQLNCNQLGIKEMKLPIYISEHLTVSSKRLLSLAREFAKAEGYRFCWSSNDRIFLRRKENEKHILVKDEDTLKGLKQFRPID